MTAALQVHQEAFAANLHGSPRVIEARPLQARREGGSEYVMKYLRGGMSIVKTAYERVMLFARRTGQPYAVSVRTVLLYIFISILVFGLLLWARQHLSIITVQISDKINPSGNLPKLPESTWYVSAATNVIDNLLATLIVAVGAAAVIVFVTPKFSVEDDLGVIKPWQIAQALKMPLVETKQYWFRGRSGRFVRDTVMPALFNASRSESENRTLNLLLPDPTDEATLDSYARYRNSLSYDKKVWDTEFIQVEIFATILAALRFSRQSVFFVPKIFIKSDFALFRIDMSDDRLIMTREDPKWPGIICSSKSKFYSSYLEEVRMESVQSKEILSVSTDLHTPMLPADVAPAIAILFPAFTLRAGMDDKIANAMDKPASPYA